MKVVWQTRNTHTTAHAVLLVKNVQGSGHSLSLSLYTSLLRGTLEVRKTHSYLRWVEH